MPRRKHRSRRRSLSQMVPIVPQKGSFMHQGKRCVWFKGKSEPVCFRVKKKAKKRRPTVKVKGKTCKVVRYKTGRQALLCKTGKGATGWTFLKKSQYPRLSPL